MHFTYITALENLKIKTTTPEPIHLGHNLFISNNPEHAKSIKGMSHYIESIGSLEASSFFSGYTFIFKRGHVVTEEAGKTELINFLRDVNSYIHILWLINDNSVNIGLGFALGEEKIIIHSNSLNQYFSKANGELSTLEMSIEEINQTTGGVGEVFRGALEQIYPKFTALQKSTNRLSAANFHLHNARSNRDLGLKIAQMCTYFECLFSTSTAELSHQLSERIAFFIEKTPEERLKTYKQIKKAYGTRSKIVHGDRISRNLPELSDTSTFCDEVARKINDKILPNKKLIEILDSPDQSILDDYMINLIFGLSTVEDNSQ